MSQIHLLSQSLLVPRCRERCLVYEGNSVNMSYQLNETKCKRVFIYHTGDHQWSPFDNFVTMVSCNFNVLTFNHEQIVQFSILLAMFNSFCTATYLCMSFVAIYLSYWPKFKARSVSMVVCFLHCVQPTGCRHAVDKS